MSIRRDNSVDQGAGVDQRVDQQLDQIGPRDLVRQAASQLSESVCIPTEVIGDKCACQDEPLRGASLEFHGAYAGTFFAMLAPAVARSLAADCFGLPSDEITAEWEAQLACELANVLCGAVLNRLDPNASIQLSTPQPTSVCPRHLRWCERLETPKGPLCVGLSMFGRG